MWRKSGGIKLSGTGAELDEDGALGNGKTARDEAQEPECSVARGDA